jgi:hypothetical protein
MNDLREALSKAKMRMAYCLDRYKHTHRNVWLDEMEFVQYTIAFLRNEINTKDKPRGFPNVARSNRDTKESTLHSKKGTSVRTIS